MAKTAKKTKSDAISSPASKFAVGAVDQLPREVVGNPSPVYPADVLKSGVGGEVVLRVTISATGRVLRLGVLRSSGVRALDKSAVAAVRQWQFQPAKKNGIAVEFQAAVPIEFKAIDAKR